MNKLFWLLAGMFLIFAFSGTAIPVSAADPVEIVKVENPSVVEPGNIVNFKVTVRINSGQLLESRGDMLRNTDGHLYGHWPHISVIGGYSTGHSYTFVSYGTMVAPTIEDNYVSKWKVWQNNTYVGGEAEIRFQVKKGSGGGEPPKYESKKLTSPRVCDAKAMYTGEVKDTQGTHYYVGFVIPGTTGTDKVVIDDNTKMAKVSITNWVLGFYTRILTVAGHPMRVNKPGDNEGEPGKTTKVPDDNWHVFIYETFMLHTPGVNAGLILNEYNNSPYSLVQLLCNFSAQTSQDRTFYQLLDGVSIPSPEIGKQYAYSFDYPSWMTSASVILRMGSHANISLRGPDGTIYNASSPEVEYLDTPQYAVLKLNKSGGGQWQALIDVTDANPDSVFFVSIGGTYGTPTNPDYVAPFTNINIEATHGNNSWLVSDARITLTADDPNGSGVAKIEWTVDDGATWNLYSGPVTISQEGLTVFQARATDNAGNVEILPPTKYLRIDKTVPEVQVWTDAPTYTRVDPFKINFGCSDKSPGSGLALCAGTFEGQPVTNEQIIDLFWLDLGKHTVYAKGADVAGWETDQNASFEMIATIQSMQATVDRLCAEKQISKKGICNSLSQKLDAALKSKNKGQNKAAINQLKALQNEVKAQTDKAITTQAARILLMDSAYVIKSLQQ